MGKRTFWASVVLGAAVGGAVSILNKNARKYAKNTALTVLENLTFYYKNPTIGFQEVKATIDSFNEVFTNTTESAVNVLEKAETTINKVTKQIEK